MTTLVDFPVKPEARPYLDAARADPDEPDWLARRRRRALARFAEAGFPSRRGEAWRYLDLRPLTEAPLPPAPRPSDRVASAGALPPQLAESALTRGGFRLALVDGRFSPALSAIADLPDGVRLESTANAIISNPAAVGTALDALSDAPDQPFAALNAALFSDGFVLDVAPGVVLEEPIEIVHLAFGGVPASLHSRSLVTIGAESRVRLFESFTGEGRYWCNDVVALRLGPGAELDRVTLVEEAEAAIHLAATDAELGAAARLGSFVLLLGGRILRHEITVRSTGERTWCRLDGAFLAAQRQQMNIVTAVHHTAAQCETRESFKGVAAERAQGAFQGRITVHPGAQKTDAHMLSRNLLLGTRAAIDTKPELEIFADDVKCSHGATVGDLDEAALFYLAARGIPRDEARRMLIAAFLGEALESVEPIALREHLAARLARRLGGLEEPA
ncbi:MAG: Fe-S cluster assembly protein SufD [Stellaceae bacterium]